LEVACGGGDLLMGLERFLPDGWHLAGCDRSEQAVRFARRQAERRGSRSRFFRLDALSDELPEAHIYVSSLFMHHLSEEEAVRFLNNLTRRAGLGLIMSDLERNLRGLILARVAPRLLTRSWIVHTDSVRSVRAAFKLPELERVADNAGMKDYRLERCWPARMVLSWSRS
jgi:SAM-dependent methyltransferase